MGSASWSVAKGRTLVATTQVAPATVRPWLPEGTLKELVSALSHIVAKESGETHLLSFDLLHHIVYSKLLAMGNDGGSIPDRRDLVKTKAKVSHSFFPD